MQDELVLVLVYLNSFMQAVALRQLLVGASQTIFRSGDKPKSNSPLRSALRVVLILIGAMQRLA